ncbi:DUF1028 domain-containing protein [Pyxidicoccus parkwayensis]|uniref:DUF1028 domain-containing protein n=1 Tax=Pyxidicoccus parkwayensis TaxID=2813578 RepID=A0ABX7NR40_9BACT|nr:DUF1028 domain-containing protein [Pyxidicoccus parkwaysis]QSQ20814.1 DUF1028 domain-containing protein [Pyxidicoccus parkwaysis]
MKLLERSLLVLSSLLLASSTAAAADRPAINTRLFGTRAIVACDPVEKTCGLAVISFPAGVSGLVPYGRSDVAVASMYIPSVDDANAIISRIDSGETPQAAVDAVMAADPYGAYRQLAAVKLQPDGTVSVGQRTGEESSDFRCSIKGATYVVQANNQTTADMCRVMAQAFDKAKGSLPQRLFASLKAGSRVGGDRNGDRSGVIRAWNSTDESAFYTHVIADAVTHVSSTAIRDLEIQLNRYQGGIAVTYAADLVPLDRENTKLVKHALHKLGYYHGPMDASWPASAEQALADFVWNNLFFEKPTVEVNGVRKIDGVLVNYLRDADLGALIPATPAQ